MNVVVQDNSPEALLAIAYAYLEEPRGRAPAFLINRARKQKHRLAVTLLTLFEALGKELSPDATHEINRQRTRREVYNDLVDAIGAITSPRALKGPAIARRYPPGVMRFVGDLDVAVPDLDSFWTAALELERLNPKAATIITFHNGLEIPNMSFSWPAEDPFLDIDLHVDLMLTPFVGDGSDVPLRALPTDVNDDTLCIALLAEEMFQRPPTLADALDLSLLLPHVNPVQVLDLIEHLRLAPESRRLLADAGRVVPLAHKLADDPRLVQMTVAEQVKRKTLTMADARRPSWHLRRLSSASRGPLAELDRIDDSLVLQTPLGRFVAVTTETISAKVWRAATLHWANQPEDQSIEELRT